MTDTAAAIRAHREYLDLLAKYNAVVDYIDSPEMASDLQLVLERTVNTSGAGVGARAVSEHLRSKLHEQPTPDGWQLLPDDGHDGPPELTNGPIWVATTRGHVSPGYYRQDVGGPTVWSSEQAEGVYKWWRQMDAEPPTINLGARSTPEPKPVVVDDSVTTGTVTHIRDRWVDVHFDGDDDAETLGCRNECGEELALGDRVVVTFVPPHQIYITHRLKGDGSA